VDRLPRVGDIVEVSDPLGYSGEGIVEQVQTLPHHAVFVQMSTITDRKDKRTVGRVIWVLAGHVKVIDQ
jgi:hypothetical protein